MASTNRAMDISEQGELVALSALQVTGGETGVPDTWYRVHAERLFSTARRITRNHEDAEDAVQDAFLSAFLHLQNFHGRSTFSTWLTRIGINSALMILRKKRNSREISAQDSSEGDTLWQVKDSAPDPEEQYADQERRRLLRQAIADLRPSIRRPLQLQTLQGYSAEKMASEIGISLSAAKARLFQAKAALRKTKVLRNISHRHVRRHRGITQKVVPTTLRGVPGRDPQQTDQKYEVQIPITHLHHVCSRLANGFIGSRANITADTEAPLLTLDEAVTLALQHNRLVKNSVLEAQKNDFEVSVARRRRKPQFQFSMLGGELLHAFDFTSEGDIPLLVRHFINRAAGRMNKSIVSVPEQTMAALTRYTWPGNVRELENVIERAVIVSRGSVLEVPLQDLTSRIADGGDPDACQTLEEVERRHILATLRQTKWVNFRPTGRGNTPRIESLDSPVPDAKARNGPECECGRSAKDARSDNGVGPN